jgi:two-component sensor histidine kinase
MSLRAEYIHRPSDFPDPAERNMRKPSIDSNGVKRTFEGQMSRLVNFDVVALFPAQPALVVQLLFAICCTIAAVALRWLIDFIWPGAGPFGLMVPVVLVATLFGRWQAGLVTLALSSIYAWYFVLPSADWPRVIVNVLSGAVVVLLADLFRRTMRQALLDRELLLREIEHRVRNNFSSVAGMLRLEIRQHPNDPVIHTALQCALGRVESYAIVNSYLYRVGNYTGTVDMHAYLGELCRSLQSSATTGKQVRIECAAVPRFLMEGDRAILVGLLVNEIVTNALKHAFQTKQTGVVAVGFANGGDGWMLHISDNGQGMTERKSVSSLGLNLIPALAKQAGMSFELQSDSDGTRYKFHSNR